MAQSRDQFGLTIVRIALGVFFICEASEKLGWFLSSDELSQQLGRFLTHAVPANRWYLERVAIPFAPIFARLVVLGEASTGISLILGAYTRLAATLALLMVLNFHFSSGALFGGMSFLTNGYALPVLGGLLGLAVGGGRLPWSLKK
ncbi:MAG: DoxX family protein [Vicinamibacterales bacterium]